MAQDAKAQIVDTQNMARKSESVGRQRPANAGDMRLPGERGTEPAAGNVKEGSFRECANLMDSITGPSADTMDMDRE